MATQGDKKLKQIQQEVDETVALMKDNVLKTLARDEKLVHAEEVSEDLLAKAGLFKRASVRLKRKMWWKNKKYAVILTVVAGIVVAVVVVAVVML
jgi:hypothetical protein